jgi:hypothetical protein
LKIIKEISLDDPEVLEAKRRFEQGMKSAVAKFSLSFEETLERLLACETQMEIAEAGGVTRQAFGWVYHKHFASILPPSAKDGRRRQSVCDLKRKAISRCTLPKTQPARNVAEEAMAHGLEVRQVLGQGNQPFRQSLLEIGDCLCAVRHLQHASRAKAHSKRMYSRLALLKRSLGSIDFVTVWQSVKGRVERFLVIPAAALSEYLGGRKRGVVYIPSDGDYAWQHARPTVNWLQYENAWYLLKKGESDEG